MTSSNGTPMHLIVTSPFGDHAAGDTIADAETVAAVLGSEHAGHVVRVVSPADPDPTPKEG